MRTKASKASKAKKGASQASKGRTGGRANVLGHATGGLQKGAETFLLAQKKDMKEKKPNVQAVRTR